MLSFRLRGPFGAAKIAILVGAAIVAVPCFAQWQGTNPIYFTGNVGIGPASNPPQSLLHIAGAGGVGAITFDTPGSQKFRFQTLPGVPNWGGLTLNGNYNSGWNLDDTTSSGWFLKLDGRSYDAMSSGMWLYRIPAGGNPHTNETPLFGVNGSAMFTAVAVSIGGFTGGQAPPYPTDALHVYGSIRAEGNITGAQVIGATYQDVAEWVPASGDVIAGTVVVLNPEKVNEVIPSSSAYDTTVAGVVSEHPGVLLGEKGDSKAKIATTGRVKVRVDASRYPVKIGDLLVTSDVAGTAMRSEPLIVNGRRFHQPGTIIGKALEPLASGSAEILVLLSLQ
jgi:hypothetical protein